MHHALKAPALSLSLCASLQASWCYNAMIHPLLSMVIKGVVWSQGEQDIYAPREYRCQFPAMIRDWRRKFQGSNANGVMPFGFTQLAGYGGLPHVSQTSTPSL